MRHHRYLWSQYLVLEKDSSIKHEFLDGEIFAMAGGTPEHSALAAVIIRDLGVQLEGKPCRVYTSDLRVRVQATGLSTYPDASVIRGKVENDPEDPNTAVNPTLIVEVLSESTEQYDRMTKFEHYRQIPSLREYVLISHRERLIEIFRRGTDEQWMRTEARTHSSAKLESIQAQLMVDRIYEGIELRRG